MCGIVGWIDFERNLSEELEILRAMTATMTSRGPDAEGIFLDTHVAFGHRRLSIIDLESGHQPMLLKQNEKPIAVLIYTGEVYNFLELRQELIALGHSFITRCDTEVVLHAWREWRERLVEHLNGMYAFAIWDVLRQELLLVRDRMGIKPLYYYPTPHGILFASEPKGILKHPLAKAELDNDGLREFLAFIKTPGHAIFRGMKELQPGHVLKLTQNGYREYHYWRLTAQPHTDDLKTTIDTVRALLEDTVKRQLICDVPRCILLSGGLDSSAITALAQKQLLAQGAECIRSFSVDFIDSAAHFQSNTFMQDRDATFVNEMVQHIGAKHTNIILSAAELSDPRIRAEVIKARDLPFTLGDLDHSIYLLFREIKQHSTVALSGEAADELFGGYLWFYDPNILATPNFPWLTIQQHINQQAHIPPFPLNPGLWQQLQIEDYIASQYSDAISSVPSLAEEHGHEQRIREMFHLSLTRYLQILLDRKDRMSMAHGLEVRVPYCDHRLVEYVFNVPLAMKTFDGREKSLLRAAIADLLPQSILERRKNPYPTVQDPAYGFAVFNSLKNLIAQNSSPVLPLLNLPELSFIHQQVNAVAASSLFARHVAEQILNLDLWLTQHRVSIAI